MQIIIPPKQFSEGDIGKAMQRELREGLEFKKATEKVRVREAQEYAKGIERHKAVKGLGRCVAVIPDWEYHRIRQKYGRQEIHSKEFLKYFQKKFPSLAPHKL